MQKIINILLVVVFTTCIIPSYAQTTFNISGNIKNSSSKELLPAVSVTIKNTTMGTFTDDKGNFIIPTSQSFPLTLVVSSIGFETQEIQVLSVNEPVSILLKPTTALGQDVVVSATRVATKILESPVSIERMNTSFIRETPAPSFYDALGNLKGVTTVTSSIGFVTPTTRGFGSSGNLRLNQLIDGMDNQAPGLNFAVGNIVGVTELDVDNVELLPGASSALYGSGGMNGTLLINSKNPFKHQGFSFQIKQGVNHIDDYERPSAPYYDWSARWAKALSNRFAVKLTAQYTQAQDWQGQDERNYSTKLQQPISGDRTAIGYNGVNMYGDESNFSIKLVARSLVNASKLSQATYGQIFAPIVDSVVSRTGYKERDVVDYNAYNVKLGGSLHYKINNTTEASLTGYWGSGNTVYTGAARYSLKNLAIGQYKAEVKGENFHVRLYTTQEDAGETYNATVLAQLINEKWAPTKTLWAPTYALVYAQARALGQSEAVAHATARAKADANRVLPGTAAFKEIYEDVRNKAIPTGALFTDKTSLYAAEGMYNFAKEIKFAEVQVGASYKLYSLNSKGTLFIDTAGRINISEIGAFVQVSKSLLEDRLKLTVAGRYDKNENFTGRFTPRFTAVYKIAKDNNLRLSYQTAYRFPSTQDQYINLNAGSARLIGGLPVLRDIHHFNTNPVYLEKSNTPYQFKEFKPESVSSYEIGYKGLIQKKLLIDVYGYYSEYTNFINRITLIQNPNNDTTRKIFSTLVNSDRTVKVYGAGLSVDYVLPKDFVVSANGSYNQLSNAEAGVLTNFNTPDVRYNFSVSNNNICGKYGFNVGFHWQSSVKYESSFINGRVPAYGTLDAQVSMKLPEIRSLIKMGGTNILNHYYTTAMANPQVGALYYISFGYNVF